MGFAAGTDAAAHLFAADLPDSLSVTGPDAHHLARVRRLHRGEHVTVADGRGTWRPYDVSDADRDALILVTTGHPVREPRLRPRLAVAFAITKGAKPELVIRQLTELGVDHIRPVFSERSVPRWDGRRAAGAAERFRRVAREAAAQCRRATLPIVDEPDALSVLAGTTDLVLADRDGSPEPPAGDWTLVVGPEGGLSPADRSSLGEVARLAVGVHVLRADTAAVAAAALLAARRTPDDHPA